MPVTEPLCSTAMNVVNFVCHGCKATLGIPAEMAGISGPCPFCGTQVTSPSREAGLRPVPVKSAVRAFEGGDKGPPIKENSFQRIWLQPQLVVNEEPADGLPQPRRPGIYIVA